MKVHSISLVTPQGCDADCPYCISRMTDNGGADRAANTDVATDNINLRKALQYAKEGGAQHVIITGKGEPFLFPQIIDRFISLAGNGKDGFGRYSPDVYNFPFIEMQTNGLAFAEAKFDSDLWNYLVKWNQWGATHVAISIVHYGRGANQAIYCPDRPYPNLDETVIKLHNLGYTVRFNCIMVNGYIDSPEEVQNLLDYCKSIKVDQLSIRPVTVPANCQNKTVEEWTTKRRLPHGVERAIIDYINSVGTRILRLPYGTIYDVNGQNICTTDCMTFDEVPGEVRQLIYMPDGSVRYSWQHEGAILLR